MIDLRLTLTRHAVVLDSLHVASQKRRRKASIKGDGDYDVPQYQELHAWQDVGLPRLDASMERGK